MMIYRWLHLYVYFNSFLLYFIVCISSCNFCDCET